MKIFFLCLWLFGTLTSALAAPAKGDLVSPFAVKTLTGAPFSWKPGKITVLSVCAFWCDTWKDQLPRVQSAAKAMSGLPVDFATVSVDGRWSDKAKSAAAGTMLCDAGSVWSHSIGIDRVPYTIVIDRNGRVIWTKFGTVYSEALIEVVRGCVANREVDGGAVYLTFDDFPAEKLSDELLDFLRAENIKATFFCIGDKVAANQSLMKRTVREGHQLAIHSWAHEGRDPKLLQCATAIYRVTGQQAKFYRPPGSEVVIKTTTYTRLKNPVDDPYDYTRPGVKELTRRVLMLVRPNAIIQLHAGVQDTLDALPEIVKSLKRRGFRFELLLE